MTMNANVVAWKEASNVAEEQNRWIYSNAEYIRDELPKLDVPDYIRDNILIFLDALLAAGTCVDNTLRQCGEAAAGPDPMSRDLTDALCVASDRLQCRVLELDMITRLLAAGANIGKDMTGLFMLVAESAVNILGAVSRIRIRVDALIPVVSFAAALRRIMLSETACRFEVMR
jgi:hypothetical protein